MAVYKEESIKNLKGWMFKASLIYMEGDKYTRNSDGDPVNGKGQILKAYNDGAQGVLQMLQDGYTLEKVSELVSAQDDKGLISPQLPKGIKNYMIDIDGTITDDIPNEEPERMVTCTPFPDALEICNQWYDEGHIITFFTSRTEEHREVTEAWFKEHGFKFHGLLMGKPRGGNYHWIDNHVVRATRFEGKFTELIKEDKTIEVFKK